MVNKLFTNKHLNYFRNKSKVTPSGCYEWVGGLNSSGYGVFGIKKNNKAKFFLAHRISYEMFYGEIPKGFVIDHICRNRKCINPKHLRTLTVAENNSNKFSRRWY